MHCLRKIIPQIVKCNFISTSILILFPSLTILIIIVTSLAIFCFSLFSIYLNNCVTKHYEATLMCTNNSPIWTCACCSWMPKHLHKLESIRMSFDIQLLTMKGIFLPSSNVCDGAHTTSMTSNFFSCEACGPYHT